MFDFSNSVRGDPRKSLAFSTNNPGNVKAPTGNYFWKSWQSDADTAQRNARGHRAFPTAAHGAAAQMDVISRQGSKGGSLLGLTSKYAPSNDPDPLANNRPREYANSIAKKLGVSATEDLGDKWNDPEFLAQTASAMSGFEDSRVSWDARVFEEGKQLYIKGVGGEKIPTTPQREQIKKAVLNKALSQPKSNREGAQMSNTMFPTRNRNRAPLPTMADMRPQPVFDGSSFAPLPTYQGTAELPPVLDSSKFTPGARSFGHRLGAALSIAGGNHQLGNSIIDGSHYGDRITKMDEYNSKLKRFDAEENRNRFEFGTERDANRDKYNRGREGYKDAVNRWNTDYKMNRNDFADAMQRNQVKYNRSQDDYAADKDKFRFNYNHSEKMRLEQKADQQAANSAAQDQQASQDAMDKDFGLRAYKLEKQLGRAPTDNELEEVWLQTKLGYQKPEQTKGVVVGDGGQIVNPYTGEMIAENVKDVRENPLVQVNTGTGADPKEVARQKAFLVEQEGYGKSLVKRRDQIVAAGRASYDMEPKLDALESMLSTLGNTSSLTKYQNVARGFASGLGLPIDEGKLAAAQTGDAILNQLIIPMVKQLGTKPTDRDLQFVIDSFPNLGKNPAANKAIIEMIRDKVKLNKLELQAADDYMKLNDNSLNGFDTHWNDLLESKYQSLRVKPIESYLNSHSPEIDQQRLQQIAPQLMQVPQQRLLEYYSQAQGEQKALIGEVLKRRGVNLSGGI